MDAYHRVSQKEVKPHTPRPPFPTTVGQLAIARRVPRFPTHKRTNAPRTCLLCCRVLLLLLLLLLCLRCRSVEEKSLRKKKELDPSNATAGKPVASFVLSCVWRSMVECSGQCGLWKCAKVKSAQENFGSIIRAACSGFFPTSSPCHPSYKQLKSKVSTQANGVATAGSPRALFGSLVSVP